MKCHIQGHLSAKSVADLDKKTGPSAGIFPNLTSFTKLYKNLDPDHYLPSKLLDPSVPHFHLCQMKIIIIVGSTS